MNFDKTKVDISKVRLPGPGEGYKLNWEETKEKFRNYWAHKNTGRPLMCVILSATIADRICYINMNRAFQEEALDVSESIQIYSVVNSLLDSCEADKVQLSVEGSMDGNLRSSMPLYTFYEKNDQLVVHEKEES